MPERVAIEKCVVLLVCRGRDPGAVGWARAGNIPDYVMITREALDAFSLSLYYFLLRLAG